MCSGSWFCCLCRILLPHLHPHPCRARDSPTAPAPEPPECCLQAQGTGHGHPLLCELTPGSAGWQRRGALPVPTIPRDTPLYTWSAAPLQPAP